MLCARLRKEFARKSQFKMSLENLDGVAHVMVEESDAPFKIAKTAQEDK